MMRKISILVLALTLGLAGALTMSSLPDRWLTKSESGIPATASESDRCQAVKVDGLCFETVIADKFKHVNGRFISIRETQTLPIPQKPDGQTIAYMGFRITNQTNKTVRIPPPTLIDANLLHPNGELEQKYGGAGAASRYSLEHMRPLPVLPGKNIYFLTQAEFNWQQGNLTMILTAKPRNSYFFSVESGTYQIQLTYNSLMKVEEWKVDVPPYALVCKSPSDCALVEQPEPLSSPSPEPSPQPVESPFPEGKNVWRGIVTAQFEPFQLVHE